MPLSHKPGVCGAGPRGVQALDAMREIPRSSILRFRSRLLCSGAARCFSPVRVESHLGRCLHLHPQELGSQQGRGEGRCAEGGGGRRRGLSPGQAGLSERGWGL